ncbi:hypothetical protein [Hydrogenivirga sp. 128-5-R1-1]|uniref:hypothetical protein n=1 Tax=Hydrogenivirga sp. 128-5-R1-1 TaxID=392423 RepID=UPI00015F1879|nr:hypothetical protein [Hydrogenivirga sp. 128-5-R1-1]EDP75394.1 hypothetical protein HG1285_15556 [Hydrogenivirga sp. 128-5-R1-1]
MRAKVYVHVDVREKRIYIEGQRGLYVKKRKKRVQDRFRELAEDLKNLKKNWNSDLPFEEKKKMVEAIAIAHGLKYQGEVIRCEVEPPRTMPGTIIEREHPNEPSRAEMKFSRYLSKDGRIYVLIGEDEYDIEIRAGMRFPGITSD